MLQHTSRSSASQCENRKHLSTFQRNEFLFPSRSFACELVRRQRPVCRAHLHFTPRSSLEATNAV